MLINKKGFLASFIVIILFVSALFGIWKLTSKSIAPAKPISLPIKSTDWVKGNKKAKAALIEYSDFQCPACAAYQPIVKKLSETYGNRIAIVYRHFPLPQHKNAEKAAYAAEAAGRQDKFWEMHDLIFKNQEDWSESPDAEKLFLAYAKELKLNENQFNKDVKSETVKQKIADNLVSGQKLSVNATPTFFLNGEKLENISNFENFKKLIDVRL